MAEKVQRFDRVADRPVPKTVKATLRDYQHRGFRWLCTLRELGLGGVLADDMGLGKTLQTLAFLAEVHADPKAGQSLVVAPTSVVHNWIEEARRFTPSLRVVLHHGAHRGEPSTDAQIIVTSYALMRIDRDALTARRLEVVVLDEAQAIKTPTSQVAQAARALDARTRLALTGTPIENNLIELWSLMQYVMPGFFGGKAAFTRRYATPIQRHGDADALNAMRRRVRPFVLRRLKDEVARELPPRQEQILYCELGPAQRRLYNKVRTTYAATVMNSVDQKGIGGSTIQVLEALTRLRQACCDPALLPMPEAAGVTRSAKRERLMETVRALIEDGHRALVFSQWPSLLKRVRIDLDAAGIEYLYLDGGTKERGGLQSRWNSADGPPLFLISLKAGGTGLNLTGADHVIHLDPWWNPAAEQQATDRAHRIGQTRPVMVYKFVARGTVEEKIIEMQARKRALADAALNGDRIAVDALSRADLEAVFAPLGAAPEGDDVGDDVGDDLDDQAVEDDASADPANDTGLGPSLPGGLADLLAAGPVSTADVAEVLAISAPTARKRLTAWVTDGAVVRTGKGRATRYTLP
ncbi:MAG: SNF2 family DNA or RNA helicase [Bradymonadia bacterium]